MEITKRPVDAAAERISEETLARTDATSAGGGIEIVLVDDSILLRRRLAFSLATVNGIAGIRDAGNVPAGLQLLEARRADLLILDIEMPGQSGLDLLKIARRRNFAGVIVMLTNHDHPKLREKCTELGADYYFIKLNDFERVAEVCSKLAEIRGRYGASFSSSNNL